VDTTRDFLRWLWTYLHPYRGYLVLALLGMILFSLTNTGAVLYVAHELFQQMEAGTLGQKFTLGVPSVPYLLPGGREWVVATGSTATILNRLILYAVLLVVVRVLSDFIRLFVMRYVSICVGRDLRDHLYSDLIRRPVTYFEQQNVGDLMSRLSSDIERIKNAIRVGLRDLVQAPLELVLAVGIVTYFAPLLSLFFLIVPLCGWAIYRVGNRIKRYSRASQDVMGSLLSRIQERFAGIKLVKSVAREGREIEDFRRENHKFFRKMRRKIVADSSLRPVLHLAISLLGLGVLYAAVQLILHGYMNRAAMGTFLIALPWIYKSIRKLSGVNEKIQTSRGAAERLDQVLEETARIMTSLPEGKRDPAFRDSIVFDRVSYRYPGFEELALEELSLELEKGENLAVVGPSGAGKSTFTDLLLRFFDPTSGAVRLDGHPLPDYRLAPYRRLFGLVTQHTILFDRSVADNIRYGREDIDGEIVRDAARRAEAESFIRELPEGFDTVIGEQGVRLSGGERQRLALARALVAEPQVLVLDEATSNVDSRSERLILQALEKLPDELTLVTISHALATVQFADRILVLNDRRREAVGEHSDLMNSSPTYRQLYEHQVDEIQTAFG